MENNSNKIKNLNMRIKRSILKKVMLLIVCFALIANLNSQIQKKYLSTKLLPYPKGLGIVSEDKMKDVMYSKLQTGVGDFFQYYVGTGIYRNEKVYWIEMESLMGSMFSIKSLKIDSVNNLVHDTIKTKFKDDAKMIALEIKHNLSNNEIQYVWLNEKDERTNQAVVFPLYNPLSKGNKFPNLDLKQLNGDVITTKKLVGKVVVINWWSIYCSPCIAEIPGLNKLVEQFKDNPDVKFIAIADNDEEKLQSFLGKKEYNYIQTISNKDITRFFGNSYPKNLIIDTSGKIYYLSIGGYQDKYIEIEREIKNLIK